MSRKAIWSLLAGIALAVNATAALADTFTGKVVSVVDGDTLNVMTGDSKERVILYGIDCPELAQPFGEEARKFTDDRCFKKNVTIDEKGHDSRGRLIAVVTLSDGTQLNQELVKQGLAWWSDKYAPEDQTLQSLHKEAKSARRGLWSAPNPIPPWIFRNGQRNVQATIKSK